MSYISHAAIEGSSVVFYMESTNLQISDFYQCYMIIVQGDEECNSSIMYRERISCGSKHSSNNNFLYYCAIQVQKMSSKHAENAKLDS